VTFSDSTCKQITTQNKNQAKTQTKKLPKDQSPKTPRKDEFRDLEGFYKAYKNQIIH
jgi:hypothetical protein